jgi:hypothetical protein
MDKSKFKIKRYIVRVALFGPASSDNDSNSFHVVEFRTRGHAWMPVEHAPLALRRIEFFKGREIEGLRPIGGIMYIGEVSVMSQYTRQALYYQRQRAMERKAA